MIVSTEVAFDHLNLNNLSVTRQITLFHQGFRFRTKITDFSFNCTKSLKLF